MSTSRGVAAAVPSSPAARPSGRLGRSMAAAIGLLVVIGASAIGLHDVAESHLAAPETSTHA